MKTTSVAAYLLRDAAKKAGIPPAELNAMGETAWAELYARKIVDSPVMVSADEIPADLLSDVEAFLNQLRSLNDPDIDENLNVAALKASAPKLQSTETIILSVAAGAALVLLVARFGLGTITYHDGKLTLKLSASDSEHTTGNLSVIGKFLARLLPFVGGGDQPPPGSDV